MDNELAVVSHDTVLLHNDSALSEKAYRVFQEEGWGERRMIKRLSDEQMDFLNKEFGITDIDHSNIQSLKEIRLKCFDIETEECFERLSNGIDTSSIGVRGDMAVSIIDDLEDIINMHS